MGASWGPLGASWGVLGASWGRFGGVLGGPGGGLGGAPAVGPLGGPWGGLAVGCAAGFGLPLSGQVAVFSGLFCLGEKWFLERAVLPWNHGRTGGSTNFWGRNGFRAGGFTMEFW